MFTSTVIYDDDWGSLLHRNFGSTKEITTAGFA
jgi:hypothetical protein